MKACYRFANYNFVICSQYQMIHDMCQEYQIDREDGYIVQVSSTDIDFERERSAAEDKKEGIPICHFTDEYLETLAVYRKIAEQLIDLDTILFHGSVIAVDGVGYLFTAKSGTGKSTHTRLWREYYGELAVMVNDDKPLLHIGTDGVTAFGTPWDGKHRLSNNISVPLKAICFLNRDETNHIERVRGKDVYPMLLQQTYRSSNPMKIGKTLELLDELSKSTDLYRLGCNMEMEAAKIAYDGMQRVWE